MDSAFSILRPANIKLPSTGGSIAIPKVLLDTGASHHSYIDESFLEANMSKLEPCVQTVTGESVVLADRRTILNIGKVINVELEFTDQYLEVHTSAVTLHVLDMPGGMDVIIGFPDIITKYSTYFLNVMTDIHEKAQKPWTSGEDGQEESPEKLDTAIPSSFAGPLYYIMNEREEVLQDHYNLFEKHLASEMVRAVPGITDLLKSDLALQLFVPEVWKGIEGFPPLELKFEDTMPSSLKPPASFVNPCIYEKAHLEFQRRVILLSPLHLWSRQRLLNLSYVLVEITVRLICMLNVLTTPYPMCNTYWKRLGLSQFLSTLTSPIRFIKYV